MDATAVLARVRVPAPRLPRRAILIVLAALVAVGGGFLLVRDSPLVRVNDVTVLGTSGPEAVRIRLALEEAGRDQSTLHVRVDQLRQAVARYTSVAGISVATKFPHRLVVTVRERVPVAVIVNGSSRVPVGREGQLLRGVPVEAGIATISVKTAPTGRRLTDRRALGAVSVLAAAPKDFADRITRTWYGPRGLVLELRDGPALVFGTATEAARKWAAAVAVLLNPAAAGALYLDLRVPERVAAGGVAPVPTPTPTPIATVTPAATVAPLATPAASVTTIPATPTITPAATATANPQP